MKKKLLIGSLVVVVILLCIFYFVVLKNKKNKVVTEGVEVVPTMNDKIDSDSTWCGTFQLVWNDMINEVVRQDILFKDNNDIIILDKTNNTKGLYTYNTFLLAGDTLWYKPVTLVDKLYNYPMQNDSRFILSELSKKDKIQKLHNDSISWYNNLPNDIDLIITHIPPFRNKSNSRGNNSCYYTEVKEYKSPVWIYGHDHKEEDIIINNTRLVSNPWGYDTKDFKVKTLTLTK